MVAVAFGSTMAMEVLWRHGWCGVYFVLCLLEDVATALIEKSHARCAASLEKVNVIRCQLGRHAWNIHVSRHLPSTTSDFLIITSFASLTHISSFHINLNGSRRAAIRAAITHSRRSQLRNRHCGRPLPQLFMWLEPHRSPRP